MTEGKWRRLEWWGIPLILSAMIGLHYGYRLSGGAMWSILFGSVNESAWEHVKALLLPYLAWAAIEWCAVRVPLRRMAVAKAAGAFLMAGVFISLYFLEFLIPGIDQRAWHLLCASAAVILAQILSERMMDTGLKIEGWAVVAVFSLVLLAAMYLAFTVNPPKIILFQDPDTAAYGLLPRPVDSSALFGEGLLS
jgi:hypothetical protein